jgi:hypothetical protein
MFLNFLEFSYKVLEKATSWVETTLTCSQLCQQLLSLFVMSSKFGTRLQVFDIFAAFLAGFPCLTFCLLEPHPIDDFANFADFI